jgi:hypothetical protein
VKLLVSLIKSSQKSELDAAFAKKVRDEIRWRFCKILLLSGMLARGIEAVRLLVSAQQR